LRGVLDVHIFNINALYGIDAGAKLSNTDDSPP
jgi:hypothetical protein